MEQLGTVRDAGQFSSTRTVLLVHGVGDVQPKTLERLVVPTLRRVMGRSDELHLRPLVGEPSVEEYNWNAMAGMTSLDRLEQAAARSSVLGFANSSTRSFKILNFLWEGHEQLGLLFVPLVCWVIVAHVDAAAAAEWQSLDIGIPLGSALFPWLPPSMVAASGPTAMRLLWMLLVIWPLAAVLLTAQTLVTAWSPPLAVILRRLAATAVKLLVHTLRALRTLGLTAFVMAAFLSALLYYGIVTGGGFHVVTSGSSGDGAWSIRDDFSPIALNGTNVAWSVWIIGAAFVAYFLLKTPVKVLKDVLLYLGDGRYREDLLRDMSASVVALAPTDHLVIAAHSLGSVIAIDSLLRSDVEWARFPRITLVTCGSPLKRLMARFFPSEYPPPTVLAGALRAKLPGFTWINLYRPLDYIGGGLFERPPVNVHPRSAGQATKDIRMTSITSGLAKVRQWTCLHTGYWADLHVIRTAVEYFTAADSSDEHDHEAAAGFVETSRSDATAPVPMRSLVPRPLFLPLLGAGPVFALLTVFVLTPRQEARNFQDWSMRVDREGTIANGRACKGHAHFTFSDGRNPVPLKADIILVRFGRLSIEQGRYPHVDWRALGRWLERAPRDAEGCAPIEIRHAKDPTVFLVTNFTQQPRYSPNMLDAVTLVVMSIVYTPVLLTLLTASSAEE